MVLSTTAIKKIIKIAEIPRRLRTQLDGDLIYIFVVLNYNISADTHGIHVYLSTLFLKRSC